MQTLVIYDIGDNRLRLRIEKVCRDAGLGRAQFSAFLGDCSEERRERLCERVKSLVDAHVQEETTKHQNQCLQVLVLPVCGSDIGRASWISRDGRLPFPVSVTPPVLFV